MIHSHKVRLPHYIHAYIHKVHLLKYMLLWYAWPSSMHGILGRMQVGWDCEGHKVGYPNQLVAFSISFGLAGLVAT